MGAYNYFQEYEGYFWKSEDNGTVLVLEGGSTLAYAEFAINLLSRLSEQGIPSFGSLLLVLAATNESAIDSVEHIKSIVGKSVEEMHREAFLFMGLLRELPLKYRTGDKLLLMLQTIFYDCHNMIKSQKAKRIISEFRYKANRFLNKQPFSSTACNKDFKTLSLLYRKFPSVQSIVDAIAELTPIAEPIILPSAQAENNEQTLYEKLMNNPETYMVASLIKHLWSGLNLPYSLQLPSEQPLGGVSDLTNKGDYDKLLTSELANDDLVLLSRLANNEALYYRREVPPLIDDLERTIIIDVSLANWGTPKIIAYAILLALSTHPKTRNIFKAYVVGDFYKEIRFDSIDEVVDSIQILSTCISSSSGLEKLLKENKSILDSEVFFITSKELLRNTEMQKCLSDVKPYFDYLIFTDTSGKIDLFKKTNKDRKLIQTLELPLRELWKKPVAETKNNDFHQPSYPILCSADGFPVKGFLHYEDEVFVVTNQNKLFRIPSETINNKGWQLLIENLPNEITEYSIGKNSSGEYLFLGFIRKTLEVIICNLQSKNIYKEIFKEYNSFSDEFLEFFFHQGSFYHYCDADILWRINETITPIIQKEKASTYLMEVFQNSLSKHSQLKDKFKQTQKNAFKKLKSVHINNDGNLVINNHELVSALTGEIYLTKARKADIKIKADSLNKYDFRFPDGSCVSLNNCGIITLQSSDSSADSIYLPASFNTNICLSTKNEFAGNEYYYPFIASNLSKVPSKNFMEKYLKEFLKRIN